MEDLFKGVNFEEDMEIAEGCFRYIRDIFQQLEEFRAFELLRNGLDRTRYLLVKEAKVIAMTCTHAALTRDTLGYEENHRDGGGQTTTVRGQFYPKNKVEI